MIVMSRSCNAGPDVASARGEWLWRGRGGGGICGRRGLPSTSEGFVNGDEADGGGEGEFWEEICGGDADAGGGAVKSRFGAADVRSSAEQVRGKADGNFGRGAGDGADDGELGEESGGFLA